MLSKVKRLYHFLQRLLNRVTRKKPVDKVFWGNSRSQKRWWKANRFKLVEDTPWWKREYRGRILPFEQYQFSLSLETLTGRHNVKRPSPTVTHLIAGSYSLNDDLSVSFLTFYCERLALEDAIAVQEEFRLWLLNSLERYKDLNVLKGYGRAGF